MHLLFFIYIEILKLCLIFKDTPVKEKKKKKKKDKEHNENDE